MAKLKKLHYNQRSVIEFIVPQNDTVVNIYTRLCSVYESCAVIRSTVLWWTQIIKASARRGTVLHDLPRSWLTASTTRPDILNRADVIIPIDRRVTIQQLASQISVDEGVWFNYRNDEIFTDFVQGGLFEVSQIGNNLKGKQCPLNCWRFSLLCPRSLQMTKHGRIILSLRQKGIHRSNMVNNNPR